MKVNDKQFLKFIKFDYISQIVMKKLSILARVIIKIFFAFD